MHAYEVGKPYSPTRRQWPQAVDYNYRDGEHELRAFFPAPRPREIQDFGRGRWEFALLPFNPDILFLLYKFGRGPWSDAAYNYHLTVQAMGPQELPPALTAPEDANKRAVLTKLLVDAGTGIILSAGIVTFSPAFTRALHAAIREQAARPFPGPAIHKRMTQDAYRRYPTTDAMVRAASIRCTGGD